MKIIDNSRFVKSDRVASWEKLIMPKYRRWYIAVFAVLFLFPRPMHVLAACDCGSTDGNNPCTGKSITVTVTADPAVHGSNSTNATFTYNFNSGGGDAYCGQFANGDYWVAPASGQTSVQITSINGSGSITADANPEMEDLGLLNNANSYGNYDASQNIIPSLPISYSTTTSIVSAIQRDEATEGDCGTASIVGECVDAYDVLTVLPSVPADAGSTELRPNITGATKTMLSLSDFDFTRLPSISFLNGTDTAGLEAIRQRWSYSTEIFGLENSSFNTYSEGGRAFRSHILISDYGAGMAQEFNNDLMTIFSSANTLSEKEAALAAMLTYGNDLYNAMYNAPAGITRYWGSGASQHAGKFLPVVFFVALLKDQTDATKLEQVGPHVHDIDYAGPEELAEINNGVNGPVWGCVSKFTGSQIEGAYWANMLDAQCFNGATGNFGACNPLVGPKDQKDPYGYIDGPAPEPGTSYFDTSLGVERSMAAAMLLMPQICTIVNDDTLIHYVDRVQNGGIKTFPDPCAAPDPRENPSTCDPYHDGQGCVYYKVTWGPDPNHPGQCIENGIGRFPTRHGVKASPVYTSSQVEANWAAIRNYNGACVPPPKLKAFLIK